VRSVQLDTVDLRTASAVMLAAAVTLPLLPGEPGVSCPLRSITGIPCPLCGMTTSVEHTLRFDFGDALAANPAGVAAVVVAIALLVLRPRRLRLPAVVVPAALAAMWVFELHRFGVV
jgi:uncharacterized protein DUF2752